MTITYGSVCSGIEAASVAWSPLGWQCRFVSEIEKFPCAVLKHHFPSVPNFGDMTKFMEWPDDRIDVLVGGTPCQPFSIAGLRRGLADPRGNLALVYLAILDKYRPRWCIWENVPGVLSTRDNAFGCFMGALVGADGALRVPGGGGWPRAGMVTGARARAAWRVLDSQHFGLAQRRKRVFVVVCFGDDADPAAILFEPRGVHGDSHPRGEAGKDVAETLSARSAGGGGLGTDFELAEGVIPSVAMCLTAGGVGRRDAESETLIPVTSIGTGGFFDDLGVTHALRGEGFDAGQGGSDKPHVLTDMAVRRLTPRECARLQGFPDDHTLIEGYGGAVYKDDADRAEMAAYLNFESVEAMAAFDPPAAGPQYKTYGNAMTAPVLRWILGRIVAHRRLMEAAE